MKTILLALVAISLLFVQPAIAERDFNAGRELCAELYGDSTGGLSLRCAEDENRAYDWFEAVKPSQSEIDRCREEATYSVGMSYVLLKKCIESGRKN